MDEKNKELEQKIEGLEMRVLELESFVSERKQQQISFPIDDASKEIILDIEEIRNLL